jgi:hypothetical protein
VREEQGLDPRPQRNVIGAGLIQVSPALSRVREIKCGLKYLALVHGITSPKLPDHRVFLRPQDNAPSAGNSRQGI